MHAARSLLTVLLFATLAVAGCSSNPDGGDDGPSESSTSSSAAPGGSSASSSQSRTATSSSTSQTGQGGQANRAPAGNLAAAVNGTAVQFTLNGTDPDGDDLAWTLSFGDAAANATGAQLPAFVNHTYAAGSYVAVLVLDDGEATTSYNASLLITPGGVETQAYSGNFFSQNARCASASAPYDAVPDSAGLTYDAVAVLAGTRGRPFHVTFASGAAIDAILFLDAAEAVLSETKTGLPADLDWELDGTVPATAALVVFYGCGTLPNTSDDVPPEPVGETFDYTTS